MENESDKVTVPPYISYKTFTNFTDGLKPTMPKRLDKSLMSGMSGGAQSQLWAAIKATNLILPDGKPTDKLVKFVNAQGADRKVALREILHDTYPYFFDGTLDLATATVKQVEEEFQKRGATGETVRKCFVFFVLAAKDAEIKLSPFITSSKTRAPRSQSKPRTGHPNRGLAADDDGDDDSHEPEQSWQKMLLAKFPAFDPAWPSDVQSKWFENFEKLMQIGKTDEAGV